MPRKKGVSRRAANQREVSISSRTLIQLIAIIVGGALLYFLREIVAVFLIALLLAAVIEPYANWGKRFGMPKGVSVGLIYAGGLGLILALAVWVMPIAIAQTQEVFNDYAPLAVGFLGDDPLVQEIATADWFNQDFEGILESIQTLSLQESLPEIARGLSSAFGIIVTIILILILAFYMVVDSKGLKDGIELILPKKYSKFVFDLTPQVKDKIGAWLRGQLVIMVVMFAILFVSLSIIGVPFALALAILTGLLEIVPFLGPIIASVPAILVAFSVSPVTAILVAIVYFLAEQIEGDILTPKIMQKIIGINPIFSILALLVGFEVAGVVGAILAIPLSMVIGITVDAWLKLKHQ